MVVTLPDKGYLGMPLSKQLGMLDPLDRWRRLGLVREDNTLKGLGWLGSLPMQDNSGRTATELSIVMNLGGKEVLMPSLVPTLSQNEINHLLSGGKPTREIIDKAVAH